MINNTASESNTQSDVIELRATSLHDLIRMSNEPKATREPDGMKIRLTTLRIK